MRRARIRNVYGLEEVTNTLRTFLREQRTLAVEDLQKAADKIYGESVQLVPVETGKLRDSITVDVSRSPRCPGLIVSASAFNDKTGFDYAPEQEENEYYMHEPGKQAHFLEEPFREAVEEFLENWGGDTGDS